MSVSYDAILIVSFGGPEGPDDVIPFLENVLRGRNVPRERMLEVAKHYQHFGGISPINAQVRELIAALRGELSTRGVALPIYWGNRNWHPMLPDTLREMRQAGVTRALAFVTAAYSSYSSCRQYREDIGRAQEAVGAGAPAVDKVRVFYNHPRFISAGAARLRAAIDAIPVDQQQTCPVIFTAHSIPTSMSNQSSYAVQLAESCRLVAEAAGLAAERWQLAYQSRSGRPEDPWLEPDVSDAVRTLHKQGHTAVVVDPIGFLSDHMEVLYDLDCEVKQLTDELGMTLSRAATVGVHPEFVGMVADLLVERMTPGADRPALGNRPANHDVCPSDCCPAPARRPAPAGSTR